MDVLPTRYMQGRPNAPLEILMPEGHPSPETPRITGRLISLLVASQNDTNAIDCNAASGDASASDDSLLQFIRLVSDNGHLDLFVAQSKSIMFSISPELGIGTLGCIQQPLLYSFLIFEHSPLPQLKWTIQRTVRNIADCKVG